MILVKLKLFRFYFFSTYIMVLAYYLSQYYKIFKRCKLVFVFMQCIQNANFVYVVKINVRKQFYFSCFPILKIQALWKNIQTTEEGPLSTRNLTQLTPHAKICCSCSDQIWQPEFDHETVVYSILDIETKTFNSISTKNIFMFS